MKLTVTFMPPFPTAQGPVHLTKEYDDVESWEIADNVLIISFAEGVGKSIQYNWAHVRGVEVDEFPTVRPNSGLVRP